MHYLFIGKNLCRVNLKEFKDKKRIRRIPTKFLSWSNKNFKKNTHTKMNRGGLLSTDVNEAVFLASLSSIYNSRES